MLLLFPVQLPGFGSFAKETPPAEVLPPGRMTYNGVVNQMVCGAGTEAGNVCDPDGKNVAMNAFVCDPAWSGVDGSLVAGSQFGPYKEGNVNCKSACAKVNGANSYAYDWCWVDDYYKTSPSWTVTSSPWCWCKAQPMWFAAEPSGCAVTCDQDVETSGTPGAVTCSTGNDADCDASAKPYAKVCPPCRNNQAYECDVAGHDDGNIVHMEPCAAQLRSIQRHPIHARDPPQV